MIFLCNPNNPTGQTTEKELLIRVMNRCNKCGTILVLDECFIEFLEEPERYECRGYLTQYPNVVIIKAFTKIFCMPGVRKVLDDRADEKAWSECMGIGSKLYIF